MKCANLASEHFPQRRQLLPFYKGVSENHERGRNRPTNCKTGTGPPDPQKKSPAPLAGGNRAGTFQAADDHNASIQARQRQRGRRGFAAAMARAVGPRLARQSWQDVVGGRTP